MASWLATHEPRVGTLNWVDWLLVGIIAGSALIGLWRGFVVEVLSLLVWVAAFWLALHYGSDVAAMFADRVDTPSARMALGHLLLFVLAIIVGGLLTWLIGKLVRATGLSLIDRLLGLSFGLLRGAGLAVVLVLVLGFTPLPSDPWWQRSQLLPSFEHGAQWLRGWLPEAAAREVHFPQRWLLQMPVIPGSQLQDDSAGKPVSNQE